MKLKIHHLFLVSVIVASALNGQIFPLSENTWNNPEFVNRFTGSYGFDTGVTPSISTEESTLFESIAPLVGENPKAAIALLKEAIGPNSSAALIYTLGNLHLQTGSADEAKASYRDAIKAFPNFLRAYKNLGIVHIQEGEYREAVKMLLKSLELGGHGSDVYGLIGFAYLNLRDSVSALRAYEHALFFDPESRDWRMGKVQALSNLKRYDDAIAMIDQLIDEFPQQNDLLLLQANAFLAKGQSEDAAATLEILRARGHANASALMLLGDIYLNFRQPELALDSYRGVADDKSLSAERAIRIARRLAATSAWEQVDSFLDVVESNGKLDDSPEATMELLNLRAQSDLAQNRAAAAAEKLAVVVSKDPLNGEALLLLANYYWNSSEIERAEIYYERAAKVASVAVDALVQHARMLVSQREFRKAVALLERAQTLKPQNNVGQFLEKVVAASRTTGR